jgi:phage terminase small subunit
MPRKSAASLSVVVDTQQIRLRPPADMPGREREIFVALIAANPPTHFRSSDLPLLTQYCAASVLSERALDELRREAVSKDGKASPWLQVFGQANKACMSLSMRLRLSPQARQPNNPTRREPQLSAYEKMRLSNADDNGRATADDE